VDLSLALGERVVRRTADRVKVNPRELLLRMSKTPDSPQGMRKSAPGLCGNALPWEAVGAIRFIPEGDEYVGAFVIHPLQGMGRWLSGCPRVAAGPQPWAALLIPFGERDASLKKSR